MHCMSLPVFLCQNKKKTYEGMKNADTIALVYAEISIQIVICYIQIWQSVAWKNSVLRCLFTVLANPSTS